MLLLTGCENGPLSESTGAKTSSATFGSAGLVCLAVLGSAGLVKISGDGFRGTDMFSAQKFRRSSRGPWDRTICGVQ
jgi:hypothetical protein